VGVGATAAVAAGKLAQPVTIPGEAAGIPLPVRAVLRHGRLRQAAFGPLCMSGYVRV